METAVLRDIILKNRPTLSEASVKGYVSILKNLYVRVAKDLDLSKAQKFFEDNADEVLAYLVKEYPFNTRKTKLAALVVFVDKEEPRDLYHKHMKQDWDKYKQELENQEKDENMEKYWITQVELKEIFEKLKRRVAPLFKEDNLGATELYELQKLIVLAVYTMLSPRRLMDYTEMKIRSFDKAVDNYWDGSSQFNFNKYKTAKTYGKDTVALPKDLKALLMKWKKKNTTDYLLFDKKGNKLTQPKLTLILNEILGKGRSVNALRHSFVSETVLKDMPKYKDLKEVAENMGTSVNTMILGYKKVSGADSAKHQT